MYTIASLLVVVAFLGSLYIAASTAFRVWQKNSRFLSVVEMSVNAITLCLGVSSLILICAFVLCDFSVIYVAKYSDRTLPIFYKITAFWAGQEGSLLFWAFSVAVFGSFFLKSGSYKRLTTETKLWFWIFFMAIIAFFLLLITCWSNPFLTTVNPAEDGSGLNPLLQNPGMIFHPPLLFLGYGGFVIPGCLALAQVMSRQRHHEGLWSDVARPFTMLAWTLLSAGIILGAWWAYMELGWGGYWGWDPVENASLIPWLIATAFVHTSVVESKRGKLQSLNILLISLTTISAFFATYLVRSGVIESLHGYPDGGVGKPLLLFIIFSTLLSCGIAIIEKLKTASFNYKMFLIQLIVCTIAFVGLKAAGSYLDIAPGKSAYITFRGIMFELSPALLLLLKIGILLAILSLFVANFETFPEYSANALSNPFSREGFLLGVAVLLLALGLIILLGTLWPLFSLLWSSISQGLGPDFYNRACLPVFMLITLLLVFCPWVSWSGGMRDRKLALALGLLFITCSFIFMYITENVTLLAILKKAFSLPKAPTFLLKIKLYFKQLGDALPHYTLASLGAAAAIAAISSLVTIFMRSPQFLRFKPMVSAHGIHLGLAIMALGVAFSGPYQQDTTFVLQIGQTGKLQGYSIHLDAIYRGTEPGYSYHEAEIIVSKDEKIVGVMSPQRRKYDKYQHTSFAESYTLFSFGTELYASLLAVDERRGVAQIHMSTNPLVNWLWIGGVILCLFPLYGLNQYRRREE